MLSRLRRLVTPGFLIVALSAAVRVSNAQEDTWKPAEGMPPAELRWPGKQKAKLEFKDLALTGQARWDMRGQLVSILWVHEPTRSAELQEIHTSYWPTSIVELADGKSLAVAGKRQGGNTIIEFWHILAPELVPKDEAKTEYLLKPAAVERVDTIYDTAAKGRDLVVHLVRKLGTSPALLVQFADSRDVYDVDLAAKPPAFKLVASPNAAASIPAVPQLVQRYTRVLSADHATRGYVYAFANDEHESVAALVLLDADRNGALDGSLVVPPDKWAADGWNVLFKDK